jgi:hypothetical protein
MRKHVEHLASRLGRGPSSSLDSPITTLPALPLRSHIANLIVQKLQKHLSNNNKHAITAGSRDESSVRQHCGDEIHVASGKRKEENCTILGGVGMVALPSAPG